MKKQLKVLTAVLCSAAISLNTMSYLNAEISQDRIDYKGLPISDPVAGGHKYFPDQKFQDYLKAEVDTDVADGYLSDKEINAVKEIDLSDVAYKDIQNIKGIEVFTNLERFICENLNDNDGKSSTLELTFWDSDESHKNDKYNDANRKLKYVSCNHSNVSSIDLGESSKVTYLNCSDNYNLSTLDLTKSPKLEYLYCSNTKLATPDLSKNTELRVLDCSYKKDTSNIAATGVTGVFDPTTGGLTSPVLTGLDLSKNAKLEYLDCSGNTSLSNLTLASDFSGTQYLKGNALEYIDCHDCGLANLDLQHGTVLQYLNCSNNTGLTGLDISKNTKLEYLDCSCEPTAKGSLTSLTLGKDSVLKNLDCSNTSITDLNLTDTITLESLNCAGTDLTKLNLSKNTALESLLCEERMLTGGTIRSDGTVTSPVYTDGTSSKITELQLNRLLYKKAGLSFNEIFANMDLEKEITIDYDETVEDKSTNVDIYYTKNALDIINVIAKDITKPAKFKEGKDGVAGTAERTITYTNLDGTTADLIAPEKEGDYTLSKATHLFKDVNRTSVINGEPIIIYSNGTAQKITADDGTSIKKDTRKTIVYTDIAASYKVSESGKAGMGKVVVGITETATMPTVTNNKIDGTSTIATAKIKNGQITISAGNNATSGNVCYLWIIDTGSNGTYECCPINVLVAPRKIEVRNEEDKDSDPQLKDAARMIGEELEVCIAGYADTAKTTRTMDSTYSFTVPEAVKECVEITPKGADRFVIKAKSVNNGKDTKVPITFKCNQNKQKIKFTFKVSAAPLGNSTTTPSTPVTP